MNKFNKYILLIPGLLSITACNKTVTDLKTISDDKVVEIANGMLTRLDSSSYVEPSNFVIKNKEISSIDQVLEERKTKLNKTTNQEFSLNLSSYLLVEKTKSTSNDGSSSEEEIILYYDKQNTNFYTLINKNGLKTKIVEQNISEESAKSNLKSTSYQYIVDIKNREFLNSISQEIAYLKREAEDYKGKTDEYFKYKFGSNDEKSLQLKKESKNKYLKDDLEGYITSVDNSIMMNDKMYYVYNKDAINVKDKENIYYMNNYSEKTITYTYDNAPKNKPNVNDYKEI